MSKTKTLCEPALSDLQLERNKSSELKIPNSAWKKIIVLQ